MIRQHLKRERGATLMWVAGMLVALMGASAFAVDLGWLYLNASRLQKAADAAALAGVVNLPASPTLADTDAQGAASANQFPIGGANTFASEVLTENRYHVTLGTDVDTFFLKAVGISDLTIARESTAQYVLPVPMGSPANCFGVGNTSIINNGWPSGSGTSNARDLCDNYAQNFWGAINGRQTAREHGDPYMTECITSSGGSCTGANPWHDSSNFYYYAIEVPNGKTFLDVWLYDAGFYARTGFAEAGDSNLSNSTSGGANMRFTLKRPDLTPHDPTDNTVHCTLNINAEASSSTYRNRWARVCSQIANPTGGLWVLQVQTTGNIGGTSHYSILANTNSISATSMPRVYGINAMGIFTNESDGNATVYLAEVLPVHAGKKLQLEFFDPGESAPPATMTVLMPNGSTATGCSWTADNGNSGSTCSITTANSSGAIYNGQWITMTINIPSNYTCTQSANGGSGCYWRMNLNLQTSHDRTTWKARVIGNPVRLVESAP